MITHYNTQGEVKKQKIGLSLTGAVLLLVAPVTIFLCSEKPPETSAVLAAFSVFWLLALLLLLYSLRIYIKRKEPDQAYLLSSRTLAILAPGKPVRFLKPCDITAIRPESMRLSLADGTSIRLSHVPVKDGLQSLDGLLVSSWFGKDTISNAWGAYIEVVRPPAWALWTITIVVAGMIVTALALAASGEWKSFAWFCNMAFNTSTGAGALYVFQRLYSARNFSYPLTPSLEKVAARYRPSEKRLRAGTGRTLLVQRIPMRPPRVIEHAGGPLLVVLGICVFIPLCNMALSFEPFAPSDRYLVLLIAMELALVALYCLWRIYESVVKGRVFTTVIISPRTLAILHPRRPVTYIKSHQCVALICGKNELLMDDGRCLHLGRDGGNSEGPARCMAVCQQWWPTIYKSESEAGTPKMPDKCVRQIAVGVLVFTVGMAFLILQSILFPGTWATVIGAHFVFGGISYGIHGFHQGSRRHGHLIKLKPD